MSSQSSITFITPPVVTEKDRLQSQVSDLYGPIGGWDVLPGESDLNVRVGLEHGPAMLKISSLDETGFAQYQTRLISFLADFDQNLPVPSIIATLSGANEFTTDEGFAGMVHGRMTSFLPGAPARGRTLSPTALHHIGEVLARLHSALAAFGTGDLPERPTNWDMRAVGDWVSATDVNPQDVETAEQNARQRILAEFVDRWLPQLQQLPTQLIHNDLNGSNVLLDPESDEVTALFDLGDVNIAPRIVDIGVAAAYLVDDTSSETLTNSLAALVSGYRSLASLPDDEVALLPHIMKTRFALALSLNSARAAAARHDPDYVTYVTRNSAGSRRRLAAVLALSETH